MATFRPIPFQDLIRRVFYEYRHKGSILGLSKEHFFAGAPGELLGVSYLGRRAATPLGPAAGPHTQLAQNLVLTWLTGARILELKTIQRLEDPPISRPCIDTQTVGFNVEWSQELPLRESLREYVKAWMLIAMIKHTNLFGEEFTRQYGDTIFDLSLGYDFKGIKSDALTSYIQELQDARKTIDALRDEIPAEYGELRTLEYDPHIIESVTISTFHGCPANEIDTIVSHLLTVHHVNVIVKLNPTLLGMEEVSFLLHDVLGYQELELHAPAFEKDLQLAQAIELARNMFHTAASWDRALGLKFTNTLVVKNTKGYFPDDVMYLSGPPLHVLALRLLQQVRQGLGALHPHIPMSFSAGIDAKNFADVISLNLVPVTVCTDFLKPAGVVKGVEYLANLAEEMQTVEAINISDYIMKRFGYEVESVHDVFTRLRDEVAQFGQNLPAATQQATMQAQRQVLDQLQARVLTALKENSDSLELLTTDALIITETLQSYKERYGETFLLPQAFKELYASILAAAAERNLNALLEQTLEDPRYAWRENKKLPKKLPAQLGLYDCASCGRCVALCPNNANFIYHVTPHTEQYANYQMMGPDFGEIPGGVFVIEKFYQIANFADCCNACSVCAIHCVEQGKPYLAKPTYFSNLEDWEAARERDGFFVEKDDMLLSISGRIHGQEYRVWHQTDTNHVTFADGIVEASFEYPNATPVHIIALTDGADGHILDLKMYHILLTQLHGVLNSENCNYVNIKYVVTPDK